MLVHIDYIERLWVERYTNYLSFSATTSFTPLLLASAEGNAEAVEMLLKNGADIYVQDKDDKSVLYWAAAQNHQNVLKVAY